MTSDSGIHAPLPEDSALHQGPALRAPDKPNESNLDREGFQWVPIRSLSARHRSRILKHLLGLDDADRYLRFGSVATDAQIGHYVDLIDFDSDEVFGIFNRHLDLLAMAHLAHERAATREPRTATVKHSGTTAEFGVSVIARARGRGYGSRLFERSVLHARNRGVKRLVIHALSENRAMLNIARRAGAAVVRDGSESQAELELSPHDVGTQVEQFVGEAVGEIDFRLKVQARAVGDLLSSMSDVSTLTMPGKVDEAESSDVQDRGPSSSR